MKRMATIAAGFALAALGCVTCFSMAQAEEVGHFFQVVNQVHYVKQGKGPDVQAKVKDGVENRDVVRTADQSRAMVRFVDDTTMTIGPKTELTIEDYLYDASKNKRQAVLQVYKGVVETVASRIIPGDTPTFVMKTPTATAGIRGTRYVTVVTPKGTLFYVLEGKIQVRSYRPDFPLISAAMKCISDALKKGLTIDDAVTQCLAAGHDPCVVIKALVFLGVELEKIVKVFRNMCLVDPELAEVCTPCVIMRCALEALRAMKEEDVGPGKYALLMEGLAPITGDLTAADLAKIAQILEKGIPAELSLLPGYTPTEAQLAEASLPGALETLQSVMGVECPGLAVMPPPPPPPLIPPTVTPTLPGGGGGVPPAASPSF